MAGTDDPYKDGAGTLKQRSITAAGGRNLGRQIIADETDTAIALATSTLQTAGNVLTGAVNETAPASDTANSGLNGRLQRIAQRITSLIALIPTALGQSTMTNSFRVVVASDQSAVAIKGGPVTLTDGSTTIATGGTAQNAVASNSVRRYLEIANPDSSRALYYNLTGSATVGGAGSTALGPGASRVWETSVPPGAVSIIGATTGQPFTCKEG